MVYILSFISNKLINKMKLSLFASAAVAGLLAQVAEAATPDEWRSRSIYFLLTDRFSRTDNSTTAECDAQLGVRPKFCVTWSLNRLTLHSNTVEDHGRESSTRYVNHSS